jgi:hypothetical protein
MANSPEVLDINPELFEEPLPLGHSLDVDATVRRALHVAFRRSSKSRQEIADEMSRLLAREVRVSMLDAFTADSKAGHRFPAAWLPAFCVVTGNPQLLCMLARAAGYHLITDDEAMLIELGRAHLAQKTAAQKIADLEQRLKGQ